MIAYILLSISGLGIILIFLKRLKATKLDMIFQNDIEMLPQEAVEKMPIDEESKEDLVENFASARKSFQKGEMHFSKNELEDAENCLIMAIESDQTYLDAHHKLGLLYMKKGDFQQAELSFSKLVNLKKDPIYFSNLGATLYSQQRLLEAAEAYENAIALDDRRAERLESLAQVYHELNDFEKALKYFEIAARRKPKNIELKEILIDYYEREGKITEAVENLKKIIELDPYNKDAKKRLKGFEKHQAAPSVEVSSRTLPS